MIGCNTWARVSAVVVRNYYLMRSSWPRLLELIYWPTVQMVLWGFIDTFFSGQSTWLAQSAGLLIAAMLLWDVLYRAQLGVSLVFFEELYSRNLSQLFISPLRPLELVAALIIVSFLRTLLGVGTAALLAILFYHFSLFDLGLPLLAFFTNLLLMGWAVGLMVSALVLRYGLGAEALAWAVIYAIAPVSGIYYPIEVLPAWLEPVALSLPSSHVFEGMRTLLRERLFDWTHFRAALLLNAVYASLGIGIFLRAFRFARQRGLLLQVGE